MHPTHRTLPAEDRLLLDPWSLTHPERRRLLERNERAQASWLGTLSRLVEPPIPDAQFPAFLLETPPFARLRAAIGNARAAHQLDTATADELQRFVDRYRGYLRSQEDPLRD
jgi:hypothetical protein